MASAPAAPWLKYGSPAASAPAAAASAPPAGPWNTYAASSQAGVDPLSDVARATGSGLASGTMGLVGLPGDIATGVGAATGWLAGHIPGVTVTPAQQDTIAQIARRTIPIAGQAPNSGDIEKTASDLTGWQPYTPQTTAGRYANTIASFVPASVAVGLTGGLAAVPAALGTGIVSGAASQAGGDLAAAGGGEADRPYGEFAGALLGGGLPGVARRIITPFPATAARMAAVRTLQGEGVTDLTAGQRTGNRSLGYFESEVGGPRVADTISHQGEQYTAAVLSRAGITANRATTDVVHDAFDRIGNDFRTLSARNTVVPDPQLQADVTGATGQYFNRVNAPQQSPMVGNYLMEIGNAIGGNNGVIPGDVYQSIRSRLSADAQAAPDQYVQQALNGMRDGLDDAMERSIAANNPNDLGAFQNARQQYRGMLVIERAANAGGTAQAEGIITPASLRTAALAVYGRRAYAQGLTPFDELARAGSVVMTAPPNSGTAGRVAARSILSAPVLIGGVLGAHTGGGADLATAGGLAAGAAASAVARAAVGSRAGRALLANQLLPASRMPVAARAAAIGTNATLPARLPGPPPILGYTGPFGGFGAPVSP